MNGYHETETVWKKTVTYGKWVCKYCGQEPVPAYIATGHDHTDYSYNCCNCPAAKSTGKPWNELN